MKNLLMCCYYDGLTVQEAKDFITTCYSETPTDRQIKNAQATILRNTGKNWN